MQVNVKDYATVPTRFTTKVHIVKNRTEYFFSPVTSKKVHASAVQRLIDQDYQLEQISM